MRIALVSLHTSPAAQPGSGDAGGMNVVVAEAARALGRAGHEVTVFTRASGAAPAGRLALGDGADLVALPVGPVAATKTQLPDLVPQFADAMAEYGGFDAVHAHYWLSGLACLPLAARSGVRPCLTLHTVAAQKNAHLAPGDRPEPPLRLAAERALAHSTRVIAGSRSELSAIQEASDQRTLRDPVVIHPGVDTELFRPASVSRETQSRLRITVLGRVQPLKGQDLAVHAAGVLAALDPELWARCELVIAGEPTPGAEAYSAELRDLAQQAGIADRVRFLPSQSRAAAASLLADSAAVLVPSHSESFGLVALEAAACGVPALVGAHTGLLEAAPAGATELRMSGRDPREWATALRSLLRDPARRAARGAEARAHALRHNWDAHATRLLTTYREGRIAH